MMKHVNRWKQFAARLRWHWIAVVATVLIFIVYSTYSVVAWRTMSGDVDYQRHSLYSRAQALSTDEKTSVDHLHIFNDDVRRTATSLCNVSLFIAWQSSFSRPRDILHSCTELTHRLQMLAAVSSNIHTQASIEQALGGIFQSTQDQLKRLKTDDVNGMIAVWMETKKRVEEQQSDDSSHGVQSRSVAVVQGIITALEALKKANADQNRQKFDTAKKDVQVAYDKLSSIQDTATDKFTEQADEYVKAVDTLR